MKPRAISILLLGMFYWLATRGARAMDVVVHEVDDSVVNGKLIAGGNGKIDLDVKSGTSPTTRVSIQLDDVSEVVIHKLAPKARANPEPTSTSPPRRGGGFFSFLFGSGSSANAPVNAAVAEPTPSAVPTSRPAASIDWDLRLADGNQVRCHVLSWTNHRLNLKLDALNGQTLPLPDDQVRQLWCGTAAARKKALALTSDADHLDTAFVEKGDDVVAVEGSVIGIAGNDLRFQYGDAERKISLARLVGVTLAAGDQPASETAFRQEVKLTSGEVFPGVWVGLKSDAVQLRSWSDQTLSIPLWQIATIDSLNGRLVYLSNLKPTRVQQTPFFGRMIPFRLDTSLDGKPITLSDGQYDKGVAMHARTILDYDLQGAFARFRSKVGFEQPAGKLGRSIVRLMGDGRTLFENLDAHGDQPPQGIDADVTGVRQLQLEVDFGQSQDVGARVIWADARLLRPKGSS